MWLKQHTNFVLTIRKFSNTCIESYYMLPFHRSYKVVVIVRYNLHTNSLHSVNVINIHMQYLQCFSIPWIQFSNLLEHFSAAFHSNGFRFSANIAFCNFITIPKCLQQISSIKRPNDIFAFVYMRNVRFVFEIWYTFGGQCGWSIVNDENWCENSSKMLSDRCQVTA